MEHAHRTGQTTQSGEIAVAHEHYYERGGGEVVAEELARALGNAPIYTGFVNEGTEPADDDLTVHNLFGDGLFGPLVTRSIFFRDAFYRYAWERTPDLWDYSVIIQSGNNPGWYVPRDHQTILKYVHSPPRTPYDRFDETEDLSAGRAVRDPLGTLGTLARRYYTRKARDEYETTTDYPDLFLANSELVARRMQLYWDVKPENIRVVYPPVAVDSYHHSEPGDYYFAFSRLTEPKRFGEIIRACNRRNTRLIIGGSGPMESELKALAGDTVEFRGYVSEGEKRELLASARGLIYAAKNEDFGIVPIEALASGCPVIGVRDGFTKHQIHDGRDGILFDRGVGNLVTALDRFERDGVTGTPADLMDYASHFSVDRFRREIRDAVDYAVTQTEPEPKTDQYSPFEKVETDAPRPVADGGSDE